MFSIAIQDKKGNAEKTVFVRIECKKHQKDVPFPKNESPDGGAGEGGCSLSVRKKCHGRAQRPPVAVNAAERTSGSAPETAV